MAKKTKIPIGLILGGAAVAYLILKPKTSRAQAAMPRVQVPQPSPGTQLLNAGASALLQWLSTPSSSAGTATATVPGGTVTDYAT